MSLRKTSVQLDDKTLQAAYSLWPGLSTSEIIRLALEYAVNKELTLKTAEPARLIDGSDEPW